MLTLIVAHDSKRGIGKQGSIPWHISADLQRFKALTMGHPIIMGRKTYESIGRPLPGRTNIVISRDATYAAEGCEVAHSLDEAIAHAAKVDAEQTFVIGGGQIYAEALPQADRLEVTVVEGDFKADTFFPEYSGFRVVHEEPGEAGDISYKFVTLDKPAEPA